MKDGGGRADPRATTVGILAYLAFPADNRFAASGFFCR